MRPPIILALVAVLILPSLAYSATLNVPSQYKTIQEAINKSNNGDVVLVAPGTYEENISFKGKAITVKSTTGPKVTTIKSKVGYFHSVVEFMNNEKINSVLDGFTITGGKGTNVPPWGPVGGGILCQHASPTIINNIITNNWAYFGAGIECIENSHPKIFYNRIFNNINPHQSGGGIDCFKNSSPLIGNNFIAHNKAELLGGGISVYSDCMPHIVNNTIYGNTAPEGGGVYSQGVPHLVNNILWENGSDPLNGGFYEVKYNNIQGGWPGEGNINEAPQFKNAANYDFHLTKYSPCINRSSPINFFIKDIDGDDRYFMGMTDIGADEYTGTHLLEADAFNVSGSAGGTIQFKLNCDPANAWRNYIVLANLTGTNPGTVLPGNVILPINWDTFTDIMIHYLNTPLFMNFVGVLGPAGNATPTFNVPTGPGVGKHHINFAAALQGPWDFVTNPVRVRIHY